MYLPNFKIIPKTPYKAQNGTKVWHKHKKRIPFSILNSHYGSMGGTRTPNISGMNRTI